MLNFNYQNPTRIIFGEGQIAQLPNYIPKDKKVLMCYGHGSIKKNGVYDQVMSALKGYDITEFSGIEPNPDYDTLMKAVAILKENGPENYFIHYNREFLNFFWAFLAGVFSINIESYELSCKRVVQFVNGYSKPH